MIASHEDTIAAIATPLGVGGLGVIRVSGAGAKSVLSYLFKPSNGTEIESHRMIFGWMVDPKSRQKVDQVLACFMRAPRSYTGEDVVEFYCHGGIAVIQAILEMALDSGARLAESGEFTKRAFLNGKMDLAQAESILDLIQAKTADGAGFAVRQLEGKLSSTVSEIRQSLINILVEMEALLDFPEDTPNYDYNAFMNTIKGCNDRISSLLLSASRGKIYREGLAAVIVGKPNVGKSCLLNVLLEEERVIVTDIPGTTRDAVEETINLDGLPLRIIDTAGIRRPKDKAEELAVERTENEINAADIIMIVVDASSPLDERDMLVVEKAKGKRGILVLNKVDLGLDKSIERLKKLSNVYKTFEISALFKRGIGELKKGLFDYIKSKFDDADRGAIVINARHKECLQKARKGLQGAIVACGRGLPLDCITIELKESVVALGEVTGEVVSEEIINSIFNRFCVGK